MMDVDARCQLFDLKTTYQFQTQPGVDKYNMPLYSAYTQPGNQLIGTYPMYQGFTGPAYVAGISVPFYSQRDLFYNTWPNYTQTLVASAVGNGGSSYTLQLPFINNPPVQNNQQFCLRGHVDIYGLIDAGVTEDPPFSDDLNVNLAGQFVGYSKILSSSVQSCVYITSQDATGNNVVIADSGQFYKTTVPNVKYANVGLLMVPGKGPYGNRPCAGGYSLTSNVVNYATGQVHVNFTDANGASVNIPVGQNINATCYFYQLGIPRGLLFFNNVIVLRNPPDKAYLVELNAFLSPTAFLNTANAIPFGYMAEYIARGAARKILADTGDQEQFMLNEPLFREQEMLVWKRSQRQNTSTRTQTLFSTGLTYGNTGATMGQGGT